jgi:hypothetical protein
MFMRNHNQPKNQADHNSPPCSHGLLKAMLVGYFVGNLIGWLVILLMAGQINWMVQQGVIQIIKTNESEIIIPSDNVLMMQVELGMANQYLRDLSSNVKRGLAKKIT